MANDLNSCSFIGRLGADPEISYLPNGTAVAKIRIACGRSWKDKQTNEKREETEWVRAVAFGRLAEVIGEYLRKGSQIFMEGRFHTSEYEKDGSKRYSTEIIMNTMQMLGGKSDGGRQEPTASKQPAASSNDFDDDIPF